MRLQQQLERDVKMPAIHVASEEVRMYDLSDSG